MLFWYTCEYGNLMVINLLLLVIKFIQYFPTNSILKTVLSEIFFRYFDKRVSEFFFRSNNDLIGLSLEL